MKIETTVEVRALDVFTPRQRRELMRILATDVEIQSVAGESAAGGQWAPYAADGPNAGLPVDLSETGLMLSNLKASAGKKVGRIKSRAWYAKFHQNGTKRPTKPGRKPRADGTPSKRPGGNAPARPFLGFRPSTVKKIEVWLKKHLNDSFDAHPLRRA